MKTTLRLTLCCYLMSGAIYGQTSPGAVITTGNTIYDLSNSAPANQRGGIKVDLTEEITNQTLLIDQLDIQTVIDDTFDGMLFLQDQGGCLNLANDGLTQVGYLRPDNFGMDGALQTKASGQIAFGTVNQEGEKVSGSDNWTVDYDAISQYYVITIFSENYFFSNYTSTVTPISSVPLIATTGSMSGKLLVDLFDLTGAKATGIFSFVVNKYVADELEFACGEDGGEPILLNAKNAGAKRR